MTPAPVQHGLAAQAAADLVGLHHGLRGGRRTAEHRREKAR
jgi:hypothetical protein